MYKSSQALQNIRYFRSPMDAPVLIIGNGIAGTTLARQLRKKSDVPITLLSEESLYFFSRTALMYVYMGHMQWEHLQPYEPSFWKKNRIDLKMGRMIGFDPKAKTVALANSEHLPYSRLVFAVGSRPNTFGWPGETANRVQGLYHKQGLEQLESWTPEIDAAVIVGGGLIGIELAEMLHSRGKKVTFLVRESSFWNSVLPAQESALINEHIRQHGIDLRLDTHLECIETNALNEAIGVRTTSGESISCQYVGLTAGVRPNIDFLHESPIVHNKGICVNRFLETNLPDVYAIGDCAEQSEPVPGRRPIEAVWYTGRMMGETLAETLAGNRTSYHPGPWFNSAKFFDIEYQIYGTIHPQPNPSEEMQGYWQHPDQPVLLRWAFHPKSMKFLGLQGIGIRLRHDVCHRWLVEEVTISEVMAQLDSVIFDPEFSPQYTPAIRQSFHQQTLVS